MKDLQKKPHPAIKPEIWAEIQDRLTQLEREHDIQIIYAVESGSRAWGFESLDSDYDVRFIYVQRRKAYLRIDSSLQSDNFELGVIDDIDISGWDLKKALNLLAGCNPAMIEWLHSPIVYRQHDEFKVSVLNTLKTFFRGDKCFHHYLSIAKNTYHLVKGKEYVNVKKYMYVLRSLLAARWIEKYNSIPPIEFEKLHADDPIMPDEISRLLVIKRDSNESNEILCCPALNVWISNEIDRCKGYKFPQVPFVSPVDSLSQLFVWMVDSFESQQCPEPTPIEW